MARQATAAVADAGPQEVAADALVQAHRVGHHRDVGAHLLTHVRDLVDERDLGRQEGVAGVLDHLRAGRIGAHDDGVEVAVELGHGITVGILVRADHDPVGLHEVGDGASLAQELGVGHVADVRHAARVQLGPHLVAGADRHGALHHQHEPVAGLGQLVDHAVDP